MAEFTTGEAVSLELPIARIPTRATAFLIDVLVQLVLGTVGLLTVAVLLEQADADDAWVAAIFLLTIVAVLVGYPVTCETLSRGRTLGKIAVGLRVVRTDGGPIDFRHALTRGLSGAIVDFWVFGGFGAIAVITSICSPNARRVGDVLAGTVVVHAQQPLPRPALAVPPPWLAGWVTQLDLTGIPEDLALAVRQYLTRLRTLTPAAQAGLGQQLVHAVCARLRIAPPVGYPPVQILGAIIAERQRRALTTSGPSLVRTG
ncbi:RDD family protein [Nocardia goodfellowii]|uniref:RDD family membrane protein YckC n=1 Tax=Nocardia goodfellowii TaxID=882446 RepID=A0ABS4Q9C9_9NOCA|nr:RDD family protein [Nocardia goodfellowii]MBP2188188.1 putative RDD family membrane protein YckC [Nocardia goodfellowii]